MLEVSVPAQSAEMYSPLGQEQTEQEGELEVSVPIQFVDIYLDDGQEQALQTSAFPLLSNQNPFSH